MIDRSILSVIESAKAYAALAAGLLTLFLSSGVVAEVPSWLPAVVVFLGAFAVWKIPNGTAPEPTDDGDYPLPQD
jgi:hypothetical protein